ncbi:FkbM family methyltransferase [Flavobacterium sp. CYK-4]|uniref:FkbM family methyltransferase n=1 Tax=Flavobacterium lotistagni TaxID=2709660 RepID=UPI00140E4147|nr:FkbM family methyltransferase [Flavobacterium lotistagni]NHM06415.1 FkbM family methyltransferase [Flavobacterium lotistagni]
MKQYFIQFLLFSYHRFKKSTALRNAIKKLIGQDTIIVKYQDFRLQAGTSSAIESAIIFDHYNEVAVLKVIQQYASQGYNFVDIGANIGVHSLKAASSNAAIEIFSFEPESVNFMGLLHNITLNGFENIRPFKMGLGNFKGTTTMNINDGWNKGKHSLKMQFENSQKKLLIPVSRLDEFQEFGFGNRLLMKIDVEGFEKEVVQGASQILQQTPDLALIMELVTEINGAETCQEIIASLQSYQFERIYKITNDNQLVPVNQFEGSADYVCLKGADTIQLLEA